MAASIKSSLDHTIKPAATLTSNNTAFSKTTALWLMLQHSSEIQWHAQQYHAQHDVLFSVLMNMG